MELNKWKTISNDLCFLLFSQLTCSHHKVCCRQWPCSNICMAFSDKQTCFWFYSLPFSTYVISSIWFHSFSFPLFSCFLFNPPEKNNDVFLLTLVWGSLLMHRERLAGKMCSVHSFYISFLTVRSIYQVQEERKYLIFPKYNQTWRWEYQRWNWTLCAYVTRSRTFHQFLALFSQGSGVDLQESMGVAKLNQPGESFRDNDALPFKKNFFKSQ